MFGAATLTRATDIGAGAGPTSPVPARARRRAEQPGHPDTPAAEHLAPTLLQADALVTPAPEPAREAKDVVTLPPSGSRPAGRERGPVGSRALARAGRSSPGCP
ncbi:hypothetical protein GCM10010502_44930 [Kitasatospora aureofaciens]|uniref:Uncharacterized protein n=1 Tax=Kitasatospora aureofaciens TaxID=1894 RepID=A0A8H9HT87_KITAU|nr:hypothetical protein GCM10010502_44930 [Kitasatospora aureofaciens]